MLILPPGVPATFHRSPDLWRCGLPKSSAIAEQQAIIAELRRRYVDGPVLIVPRAGMRNEGDVLAVMRPQDVSIQLVMQPRDLNRDLLRGPRTRARHRERHQAWKSPIE